MSLDTKWVNLVKGCLRQEHSNPASRFFQLATLTADAQPAVRTVVFRGWLDSIPQDSAEVSPGIALKIITDLRSEKVHALRKCPWAEICWYFVKSRKQFRITSRRVRIIDARENDPGLAKARKDQWKALSDAARLQFRYPTPGVIRREVVTGEEDPFKPENPSPSHPEDTFVLLLVEPHSVDMLDLRANERWMYTLHEDKSWEESFLNP